MLKNEEKIRERMLSIIAAIPKSTPADMRAMSYDVKRSARYANANAEAQLESIMSKLPSRQQWDNDR